MKTLQKILLATIIGLSAISTPLSADAKQGQKFYLKKMKACKKDGLKNGALFAVKHTRAEWEAVKSSGKLLDEWKTICPSGSKKFDKMKDGDKNNLYDFVWKYASDGEVPSCG